VTLFRKHNIDGQVLPSLTKNDLRAPPRLMSNFGDMRHLIRSVDVMRNHLGLRNVAAPYHRYISSGQELVPSVHTHHASSLCSP
jgi:hypothetical protein